MDKEYVMRVAATIREQLVTMTDTPVLMSWGIGEFMATVFNDLPGLKFHVNGRLFQGEVLICLNGSDYYEVYLRNGTDIECLSDEVCFDELGELIDRHIESGTDKEEYARFCEQAAMSFGFGVIVKTCSDICFTIGQKNCQMFVAKLHKFHHPHNRMRFYPAHSVLSFPDFAVDTFLPQRFLR